MYVCMHVCMYVCMYVYILFPAQIYHAPMDPNVGHIMDGGGGVHFKVFSEVLGLIEPGAKPYNILLQNEIDYNIFLPPLESISKGSRYP